MSVKVVLTVSLIVGAIASPTVAGASAATSARWHDAGTASSQVFSDGVRYAAWALPTGGTRLVDARRSRVRTVPTPSGYTITAIGSGRLLWSGPRTNVDRSPASVVPSVLIYDIAKGTTTAPTGFDDYRANAQCGQGGAVIVFDRIGAQGIGGTCTDRRPYSVRYNWRTGASQSEPVNGFDPPDRVEDLDTPDLTAKLCAPLERSNSPDYEDLGGPEYREFAYDRGFGFGFTRSTSSALGLWRCGARRAVRLTGRCATTRSRCTNVQLGGGEASWSETVERNSRSTTTATLYDVATKRRITWPRLTSAHGVVPAIAHTRHHLFASTASAGGRSPYRIRIGRVG